MPKAFFAPEEIAERVRPFVGGRTGMIEPAFELPLVTGNPAICAFTAPLSKVERLGPHIQLRSDDGLALSGAGASVYREQAHLKAYCEAVERYCNTVFDPAAVRVATRAELGEQAVDLELFPRCDEEEYRSPFSFLRPADNHTPIRWVPGFSLVRGEPCWVPFAAVYISSPFLYPGEAFVLPISTGSALAACYEQAAVSGICEVIERDALMLTWLQQLELPRIDLAGVEHPELRERLARLEAAGVEQIFFDATTDLGVSTIYALQIAPHSKLAVLVMAATKLDPAEGLVKVIDEASASRVALEQLAHQPPLFDPADFRSFTRLSDGAVFYGERSRSRAFDFLLGSPRRRALAELPNLSAGDPERELDRLVAIFRARGLELLVVDITVPQVRAAGLYAVKVIAPQLMPLVTNHNMRFSATPRLYDAPRRMGYPVRGPQDLNPWPQPFA